MAQKTFKIGEQCRGGIIQVKTDGNRVTIIGKEWDFSKGSRRGSDQTNAKEFTRLTVDTEQVNAERLLSEKLYDLTTSYYTGLIMDWIGTQVKFGNVMFW